MAYSHDIFISYRRDPETLFWIQEHFIPLLRNRVGLVRDTPLIYVHEITGQVTAGTSWPVELGEVLAGSRILVALWTRTFLHSMWCAAELAQMLAREQINGARTATNKYGLVVPVIIDGRSEDFPADLGDIQRLEIQSLFNTRMRKDSERAEQLSDALALHAPGFAAAIEHAPEWQSDWPQAAAEDLLATYYRAEQATQDRLPRYTDA